MKQEDLILVVDSKLSHDWVWQYFSQLYIFKLLYIILHSLGS